MGRQAFPFVVIAVVRIGVIPDGETGRWGEAVEGLSAIYLISLWEMGG